MIVLTVEQRTSPLARQETTNIIERNEYDN